MKTGDRPVGKVIEIYVPRGSSEDGGVGIGAATMEDLGTYNSGRRGVSGSSGSKHGRGDNRSIQPIRAEMLSLPHIAATHDLLHDVRQASLYRPVRVGLTRLALQVEG